MKQKLLWLVWITKLVSSGAGIPVLNTKPADTLGFPAAVVKKKKSTSHCRRLQRHSFDPWSGRSPGGWNGNPLQCSCLENSRDGGAWRATVHGVTKSQTWLSDFMMEHTRIADYQILQRGSYYPVYLFFAFHHCCWIPLTHVSDSRL